MSIRHTPSSSLTEPYSPIFERESYTSFFLQQRTENAHHVSRRNDEVELYLSRLQTEKEDRAAGKFKPAKVCSQCANKIGVIDTKEVCGSCAQTFCGNCIGQFGFQLLQRPQPCVYNKNSIRLCKECFMKFSIYIRHRDSAVQIRNHDHNIIEKTWNSLLMEENKVLELIRPHTSMVLPPSNIPAVFPNSTPPPSSPSNPNPISPQSLQQAQAAFQGFTALLVAVKKRHEERKGEFDRAFEAMKAQRKEPAEMGERDLWIMGKLIDLFITRRELIQRAMTEVARATQKAIMAMT